MFHKLAKKIHYQAIVTSYYAINAKISSPVMWFSFYKTSNLIIYWYQFWQAHINWSRGEQWGNKKLLQQLETISCVSILIVLLNRCIVIRIRSDTNSRFHNFTNFNKQAFSTRCVTVCVVPSTCIGLVLLFCFCFCFFFHLYTSSWSTNSPNKKQTNKFPISSHSWSHTKPLTLNYRLYHLILFYKTNNLFTDSNSGKST